MTYASILGLLLAAAAPDAPQLPPLPIESAAGKDVAGVRLGMTPAAVRAAMAASGYRFKNSGKALSFDQNVQVAVATATGGPGQFRTDGTSIGYIEGLGPHDEALRVEFAQWPTGPLASTVTLTIDMARQSKADFLQQVRSKYGKPNIQLSADDYQWCSPGEKQCGPLENPQLPTFHASSVMINQLQLLSGEEQDLRLRQAGRDAVARQVLQHRPSAF